MKYRNLTEKDTFSVNSITFLQYCKKHKALIYGNDFILCITSHNMLLTNTSPEFAHNHLEHFLQ